MYTIKVRLSQPIKSSAGEIMAYIFHDITETELVDILIGYGERSVLQFSDATVRVFIRTDLIAAIEVTENAD